MSDRRSFSRWWFGVALPFLALAGLFIKLTLIERVINAGDFPRFRAGSWVLLAALAIFAFFISRTTGIARFWWAWLVNLSGTLLALVDLWHYRFYGDLTSVAEVGTVSQLPLVGASVEALAQLFDWLLLSDLLVLAILVMFTWWHAPSWTPVRWRRAAAATLVVVAISSGGILRVVWGDPEEIFAYEFSRPEVVGAVGLAGYHVFDVAMHVLYPLRGQIEARGDIATIADRLDGLRRDRAVSPLHGVARGLNVLLVSAESLQSFSLGLESNGEPITPTLNAFASESLLFNTFYDQTNVGTTSDAEFIALNSMMPLSTGAVATRFEGNDFQALPATLAREGYSTFSACGEPRDYWNMWQIHARYGFKRSRFSDSLKVGRWIGAGMDDADFFRQTVDLLSAERSPFFGFLLSSSHHHPYNLPEDLRELRPAPWPGTMAGGYLQSLRYFDRSFKQLIDSLKQRDLLDSTMIVVYGDHKGHLPNEDLQRVWQTLGNDLPATPVELWRLRKRVPLMIRLPHAQLAGIRDVPGGHLDIAPTIASLLGLSDVPPVWLGRDLTAPAHRVVAFRDTSVTDGNVTSIPVGPRLNACFDRSDRPISCDGLDGLRTEADEQIWISQQIVFGNLVPALMTGFRSKPAAAPHAMAQPLTIAHRGDSLNFPEGTLRAIGSAIDAEVDVVEVDIRLTRDGVPLVFHDDTLDRTTNGRGDPGARNLAQLKKLDAGSWKAPAFAGERVVTLEEALKFGGDRVSFYLDIKTAGTAAKIAHLYDRLGIARHRAFVAIWDEDQRQEFARDMPGARLLMVTEAPTTWNATYFDRVRAQGYWGLEFGEGWPPAFVADANRANLPVFAYTINDEPTMRKLHEIGISGIESDDARLLRRVFPRLR